MSGYERPTERGTSPVKVLFWASLNRDDGSLPGAALVSPSFDNQADLTAWIRGHRIEGDEVVAWKRTIRGADFVDERLSTRVDPPADPARLRGLFKELAEMLEEKKREEKKRELDRGKRVA